MQIAIWVAKAHRKEENWPTGKIKLRNRVILKINKFQYHNYRIIIQIIEQEYFIGLLS